MMIFEIYEQAEGLLSRIDEVEIWSLQHLMDFMRELEQAYPDHSVECSSDHCIYVSQIEC